LDDEALSVVKCSHKSYILLWTLLLHPSRQFLQSLLNTIPFRTGINSHVFCKVWRVHSTLSTRTASTEKSGRDQYCCLMFNEMSVVQNLHFNQKFNCIEGFEDCGSLHRMCNVANHALVFMICGLHRKWKQPVAYYFTRAKAILQGGS
jgi:hypothetical protein